MIEAVLPPGVVWAEVREDPREARLLPGEESLVARAVEKRRREFTTGRYCARQALAQLGVPARPILCGPRGEPLWPEGVVGSITHCAGYRAAAVAWSVDVPTIGIDAEPHGPLPAGVLEAVALPEERAQLDRLAESHPDVGWDRLLFCAKEAVYKAWYPHACTMLDFHEAAITLDGGPRSPARRAGAADGTPGAGAPAPPPPRVGELRARLLVPGPVVGGGEVRGFAGRWAVSADLVLTAVTQLR